MIVRHLWMEIVIEVSCEEHFFGLHFDGFHCYSTYCTRRFTLAPRKEAPKFLVKMTHRVILQGGKFQQLSQ